MRAKGLLESKGKEVYSMESHRTVEEAIEMMDSKKISAIVVTQNKKPVGIFTERDVLRSYLTKKGISFHDIPLKDVMTTNVIIAEPNEELCNVMSVMIEKGIRHMPVSEKGEIIGMLSIRDVLKTQIGSLKAEIHYLKDYISGA
jgi:IMP dehydrogenase